MMRPICSLVGLGPGVNVGKGVGRPLSDILTLDKLIGLDGIKIHNTIASTTKTKPSGRRKLRAEAPLRVKIFRLYMVF